MYSIGQKVVCIDAEFCANAKALYTDLPVQDATYTVRDVRPGISLADGKTNEIAVLLEELSNPLNTAKVPQERAFNIERFAPLDPNFEVEIEKEAQPISHIGTLVGV
jgi:hypothetical protein